MRYPKSLGMALHMVMAKKHPDVFKHRRASLSIEDYHPDSTCLIEQPLKYDQQAIADIVIKNAVIFNGANSAPRDISIVKNVITHVGQAGDPGIKTDNHTRIIDAKGNSVLPGFIDSHLHLAVGMQRLQSCDMEGVQTAGEFREKLSRYARANEKTEVLYVFGLQYTTPPIIPAETCRHFLDDIVSDKPLLVYAHDLHTAWANTRAVDLAGLLHPMPPYPALIEALGLDDKIVLGTDNMPGGEFREPEVYFLVGGALQTLFPRPIDRQLDDLKTVCSQMAGLGITGVHRMALAQPAEDIAFLLLILELEQRGELPIRISTSFSSVADNNMLHDVHRAYRVRQALRQARRNEITAADLHELLISMLKEAGGMRHAHLEDLTDHDHHARNHPLINHFLGLSQHIKQTIHHACIQLHVDKKNPHLEADMPDYLNELTKIRCDTVKLFIDGVIEKNTAYRLDRPPGEGIPEFNQEELDAVVALADKLGLQVAAHCIGNGSVKSMLDAVGKARTKHGEIDAARGHQIPHRIEHIEICREEDQRRFGDGLLVTSMQPHESPPMTIWHEMVPKSEWNTAFSWKGALDNGAILVFGSDWPIVSCDIRAGIRHATTRKPWFEGAREQKLTLQQALAAYTSNACVPEYSSRIKGKIQPGMLADIVILSGDVHDLQEESKPLPDIRMTICNGAVTFDQKTTQAENRA